MSDHITGRRRRVCAAIMDVDGVIWIAGALAKHSLDLLDYFRHQGMPFCLLTNDCSTSKTHRYATLTSAGLPIRVEQLVTAPEITRDWLTRAEMRTIIYLGNPTVLPDLGGGICVRESGPVDAVIVGDLFDHYERRAIEEAARAVAEGAQLVAMHRNRRWSDGNNWHIDNGFWVAALEYVTGRDAIVTGKPSSIAYLTAVRRLGPKPLDLSEIVLVSDDKEIDLKGAKTVGLTTVYWGPAGDLPVWVDFRAEDIVTFISILTGGHDG